jgi:hypothetical protein
VRASARAALSEVTTKRGLAPMSSTGYSIMAPPSTALSITPMAAMESV